MRGRFTRVVICARLVFLGCLEGPRGKIVHVAHTPPSSAFGTFSPRKKTAGGEGLSTKGVARLSREQFK